MNRRTFLACGAAMAVVAVGVRLHNALTGSVWAGYDAFAHFTYIWFVAETGQVPLAHSGWQFFQPPLYYAGMAFLWNFFDGLDGATRLRVGTSVLAVLGLVPAVVAVVLVRKRLPGQDLVALLAGGLMLFLPVHLYSAGFLGNEGLGAILGALGLLLVLRMLESPSPVRAVLLGLVLGLAMLTKFTGLVIVATALGTILLKGWVVDRPAAAGRWFVVVGAVMLMVSGWFYARNLSVYGTPFRLSRDQLFLSRVEGTQLQGRRNVLEYVLFDPGILYRPQWPRGLSLDSRRPPGVATSAMKESIPTGLYANTWFDGFGGFSLPPVTASEASRRAGQLLLCLGLIPTGIMLLGLVTAVRRLVRDGWDDADGTMLLALAAMAVVVVEGTRTVPTQAAVKATYLTPVSVAFAYFFASGLQHLGRRDARALRAAAVACVVLGLLSTGVFARGRLIGAEWFAQRERSSMARNLSGVLDYAAGDRDRARRHFESAARGGWHVGYENLSVIKAEDGDLDAATWLLLRAASIQPGQTRGSVEERRRAIATTQAEYANSMAVLQHASGNHAEALLSAEASIRLDTTIPEAYYNLGVLTLLPVVEKDSKGRSARRRIEEAAAWFATALELDPAFREAAAGRAVALALLGDCDAARPLLAAPAPPSPPGSRAYPVETGPGDLNAAGLHRRRHIQALPADLSIENAKTRCLPI